MEVYKLKGFKEEVTLMVDVASPAEAGTQLLLEMPQRGEAPGVRAAKSSEFRER